MCGDYWLVNKKTKANHYPMPTLEELFDFMGEVNVFNTLDLWFGYHQLSLRLKGMKIAFWGVDEMVMILYTHWKLLPFGLKMHELNFNVWWIQLIFKGLSFIRCYIYDAIIFSHTLEEHVKHLQQLFKHLQAWGLCLHHGKCKFFHDRLTYLGHIITPLEA
jgi:hypothetical protein